MWIILDAILDRQVHQKKSRPIEPESSPNNNMDNKMMSFLQQILKQVKLTGGHIRSGRNIQNITLFD